MPQVSVVIPTYNSGGFIARTLQSVFHQTQRPAEVIVVDDGSIDETCALVRSIGETAPLPVRLVELPTNTGGPAAPLNVGIARSRSEFTATLDHDDEMMPDKLERQLDCFHRSPSLGLVVSNFYFYRDGIRHDVAPLKKIGGHFAANAKPLGGDCYQVSAEDCYAALVERNMTGSCSNFLFPKRVWAVVGGFDERNRSCTDYSFLQAVVKSYDLGVIDRMLFCYKWLEESHYRSAHSLVRKRDQLRVLRSFEPSLLSKEQQLRLHLRIRNEMLGVARLLRSEGAYGKSLGAYAETFYQSRLRAPR